MNAFEWDDCFRTGLDRVDEQHHELVSSMNRFGELLTQPDGSKPDEIERVFAELADYSKFHFEEELAYPSASTWPRAGMKKPMFCPWRAIPTGVPRATARSPWSR